MAAAGLQSSIWNNNIRSIILLALYPVIILGMVWLIAYAIAYSQGGFHMVRYDTPEGTAWLNTGNPEFVANNILMEYWPGILGFIATWFVLSWFWNTAMVNALSNAKPVAREDEPELYNLLENLCITEGMPTPKLNIVETDAMNAFATGVDKRSYSVTVTRGLLKTLQKDELEAVLGHELTHIINRDVRLMMVCVVFTGMIGFTAQMVWSSLRHGLYRVGSFDRKGGGMVLVVIAVGVILWIGYIATLFTRFALSRRRESMADAGGVKLTKNPDAMMRALMRIAGHNQMPHTTEDVNMMCIENERRFLGLFATHPPIEDRILAISQTTNTPVPEIETAPPVNPRANLRPNPWVKQA